MTEAELPRLAIEPYPQQYVSPFKMKSGEELLRPIRPEDEPKMERFLRTLSEQTVFLRYAGLMQLSTRVAHERLGFSILPTRSWPRTWSKR
ncbi:MULTISPECIES: hypothetical protein [Myxococcus]|uniref:Uncharacterized protein n=1 Tax=Myxococcus xanthus TaxID=34 RepID=A0AAE6G3C5_MYXXA|nr:MULTISPECIES: hypothetical protein [Myxococcus]QDE70181.1 hypothetical protein BHS09_26155 [Myxococcus xanthus]QDE77461.1 hypothetical protein BHS08_26180 [Myxococcus xanthus]WAM24286.1 hypothetical protein OZ403_27555 [Myxococcus sp. NMCA1]